MTDTGTEFDGDLLIEDMPEDVVFNARPPTSPFHAKLKAIQENPAMHGSLKQLAAYKLPENKGKAHTQKQNLTNYYGNEPGILGFSFVVARSVDNGTEYLGVTYDPTKIVSGRFDAFQTEKKRKAEEVKARKAAKASEKGKGETKAKAGSRA